MPNRVGSSVNDNHYYENESMQQININQPIEGGLISEDIAKYAPVLEIQIMEGVQTMIG